MTTNLTFLSVNSRFCPRSNPVFFLSILASRLAWSEPTFSMAVWFLFPSSSHARMADCIPISTSVTSNCLLMMLVRISCRIGFYYGCCFKIMLSSPIFHLVVRSWTIQVPDIWLSQFPPLCLKNNWQQLCLSLCFNTYLIGSWVPDGKNS